MYRVTIHMHVQYTVSHRTRLKVDWSIRDGRRHFAFRPPQCTDAPQVKWLKTEVVKEEGEEHVCICLPFKR